MDDKKIIELYWQRSQYAIEKTAEKYGGYCYAIAHHILSDHQYSEECVNDTYLKAWDAMPPQRPNKLKAFLGRITRNLALNRYWFENAEKRGGDVVTVSIEELENCLCTVEATGDIADSLVLQTALNEFLESLPKRDRKIFLQRYWYFLEIHQIAREHLMTDGQVKMRLHRMRAALKKKLEGEEMYL